MLDDDKDALALDGGGGGGGGVGFSPSDLTCFTLGSSEKNKRGIMLSNS